MSKADSFSDLALRLIDANGENVTYAKIAEGTYDAATGSASQVASESVIKAYFAESKVSRDEATSKRQAHVYIAAESLSTPPEINDTITTQSQVRWIVKDVLEAPQVVGITVMYKLLVMIA